MTRFPVKIVLQCIGYTLFPGFYPLQSCQTCQQQGIADNIYVAASSGFIRLLHLLSTENKNIQDETEFADPTFRGSANILVLSQR